MSSVRIAHVCEPPAETALKAPRGASLRPWFWSPQQATVSLVRIAQACSPPAATASKVPEGASVCPCLLSPQQAMVSSVRIAQLYPRLAVRA